MIQISVSFFIVHSLKYALYLLFIERNGPQTMRSDKWKFVHVLFSVKQSKQNDYLLWKSNEESELFGNKTKNWLLIHIVHMCTAFTFVTRPDILSRDHQTIVFCRPTNSRNTITLFLFTNYNIFRRPSTNNLVNNNAK